MKSKFLALLESVTSRYQRGGFLVGDYVKFIDNYKSNENYKKLHQSVKNVIDEFASSDLNIRIRNIKNIYPSNAPGSEENTNGCVVIDIAQDIGGGRIDPSKVITVPAVILELIDYYPNYAPIPKSWVRPNNDILKPQELPKEDNEEILKTRTADIGNKLKRIDDKLPTKNTKISSKGIASYTQEYLKGLEK